MSLLGSGHRASALGISRSVGRFRDGFQTSMLPGLSGGTGDTWVAQQVVQSDVGATQMSFGAGNGGVIPQQPGNSSDLGASVNVDIEHAISSVKSICRGIQDQIKKVDHRMLVMEKKQDMLTDALKAIKDLLNKIKKDSSSIKGSPFEVCTNY